ncbi:hypothetical protein FJU30_07290 [Affinibrenneria salicis]|uniref:Inner membrane protein n=1 Tax=Affinibrenneria salicis TaxID=2590031 RepID=A0A5J5G4B8_9GAMM|nr:inner membrane protein YbjM [Affinibrenneria salicis]KAA9001054.1 hypothetical protein FJU30_07290 [Affinibrenneria salicis]
MAHSKSWVGSLCSFLLFIVVFLSQKMEVTRAAGNDIQGQPGMLLFLLPGVLASFLSVNGRIIYPLTGALFAAPFCLLIMHFWQMPMVLLWQELAYVLSAVFWCVLGSMLFLCAHYLYRHYFR